MRRPIRYIPVTFNVRKSPLRYKKRPTGSYRCSWSPPPSVVSSRSKIYLWRCSHHFFYFDDGTGTVAGFSGLQTRVGGSQLSRPHGDRYMGSIVNYQSIVKWESGFGLSSRHSITIIYSFCPSDVMYMATWFWVNISSDNESIDVQRCSRCGTCKQHVPYRRSFH